MVTKFTITYSKKGKIASKHDSNYILKLGK